MADLSEPAAIRDALGLIPDAKLEAVLLRIETLRRDQKKLWAIEKVVQNG